MSNTRYIKPADIKAQFKKASPKEKEGILKFTEANTKGELGPYGYWFLIELRNLTTGKYFLAAGFGLEPKRGCKANLFRMALGLPAVVTPKKVAPQKKALPNKAIIGKEVLSRKPFKVGKKK